MKRIFVIATTGVLLGCTGVGQEAPSAMPTPEPEQPPPPAEAAAPLVSGLPTAGEVPLGVAVVQMEAIFVGLSAKRDLLGKPVFNDQNEQVGKINDLIITPDNAVSYAIIGVGGFLGMAKHDVAIPLRQIKFQQGMLVLPGATREALKALPPFEYRRPSE